MAEFVPNVKRVSRSNVAQGDIKRARELLKEKRIDEALAEFEAVLAANPASFSAHMGAGNAKLKQKQYEDALAHFKEAVRLEPLKPQGYLRAAKIYGLQRNLDKALENLQNAVKLNPKLAVAYAGIGQIYLSQEKYTEAAQQFKMALRFNPRLVMAHQRLSLAYTRLGKLPEAIAQLNTALKIAPDNAETYAGLGRIYLEQQDYRQAREVYQQAINLGSEPSLSTRLEFVEALIADNCLQEASDILTHLPEQEKFRAKVHALWGDIYQRQGLFKEAAHEYQAASLLAAEGEAELAEQMSSLDILDSQEDTNWEEIVATYKANAAKVMQRRPLTSSET